MCDFTYIYSGNKLKTKIFLADVKFEESKEAVSSQLKEHAQAKKLLDVLETNSKFFNVGVRDSDLRPTSETDKEHQWFKQGDLKHSDDINIIGFEGKTTKNYNRDRYEKKPDTHMYSLHGDPLRKGMDFAEKARDPSNAMEYSRARDPSWLPREAYIPKRQRDPELDNLAIDLPANIQHAFGTKICKQVLSDPVKVTDAVKEQDELRASFYKTRRKQRQKFVPPSVNTDPLYESLSNSVRQNMFPGYSYNQHKSLHRDVYSEDVFKNRIKDPDQWRYQRDELSKLIMTLCISSVMHNNHVDALK